MPDKSMKTAFIRVSGQNNTENGLKIYKLDDIKNMVNNICSRYAGCKYAYILHDKDVGPDGPAPEHFHIVLRFKDSIKFKYIKEVFPYGNIENARSVNACMQYLIHQNNPEKFQYSKNAIFTNFEQEDFNNLFTKDKKIQHINERDEVDELVNKILSGEVRKFNIEEYTTPRIAGNYKKEIDAAFNFYSKKWLKQEHNKQVIFITGDTGSGKTSYAKNLASALIASKNYNGFCVSSSSNDPLQDYEGQDILILDDLRDNAFKFVDILKLLDNNTSSSIQSRYNNKFFYGKLIIITSFDDLSIWYQKVPEASRMQLYRRISKYIKIDKDVITTYRINNNDINNLYIINKEPNFFKFLPKPASEFEDIEVDPNIFIQCFIDNFLLKNKDNINYSTEEAKTLLDSFIGAFGLQENIQSSISDTENK